jgi:hypothetical protein
MPNINDIFKHLPRPYTIKLQGIENYTSQNQKEISTAEAYVTRCSNILTELEKIQATDLVHIPTDLLREIQ